MRADKQELTILVDAFNLMMDARFDGLPGRQLEGAGALVTRFKDLISATAETVDTADGEVHETE